MKKFTGIMIALIFLCLGGSTLAAEWELGHESDFLLTEQAELDVKVGVWGTEGYRNPQGFGEARFMYWGDDALVPLRFMLSAGQYGTDRTRIRGAYTYPVTNGLDVQVGLHWERNQGTDDKMVSLQGNWQTDYGVVQLGMMGGTREGAHLQYEGEAQVLDWLALKAQTGVRYQSVGQDQQWTVPVGLTLTFHLVKDWDLQFAAQDAFPLNQPTDQDPLKMGLYVKKTFDLRRKNPSEEAMTRSEGVEEIQPPLAQPTVEPIAASRPEEELSTIQSGPVEAIPVVRTGTADLPAQTSTTNPTDGQTPSADPASESTFVAPEATEMTESQGNTGTVENVEIPESTDSYDPETGVLRVQGKMVNVEAILKRGRFYLPIRHTLELLGGRVYWYSDSRSICIVLDDVKVLMMTREGMYLRNGETHPMQDGLELWNGHYYIAAEELIQMVGAK